MSDALLHITDLQKDYQALRPLRIKQLTIHRGDVVSIGGVDALAAETFVHLVTGATLPDGGDVSLFGRNTRHITDGDAWLKSLDGVGMISARGILVEAFTVLQNIALSLTLDVDPIDPQFVDQARDLAREAGIDGGSLEVPVARVAAEVQMRVHVARALALGPRLLIAEHPSASLPRERVAAFGADLTSIAKGRGLALLTITADETLARAIGGTRLELLPATGELRGPGLLKKLFG